MATELKIKIKAFDKASSVLTKVSRTFRKIDQEVKKTNKSLNRTAVRLRHIAAVSKKVGGKLKSVGRGMSTYLTLPILGFGAAVFNANKNFQSSFNKVLAKAKEGSTSFDELKKQARQLGRTTRFSATQAADAMAFLAQAGWDTNKIFKATPAILDLATASGEDLAFTADIMSNTMGAFKIEASESARVADVMAVALGSSNVNLQQYADTMKVVSPVADKFGSSLEETSAMVGLLGNVGIQGSNAATAMRNAFLNLSSPATKAAKVLDELGISVATDEGKMKSMTNIMAELGKSMGNLTQQQRMKALNFVFGKRGISGAAELISQAVSGSTNEIEKFAKALENSTGAAKKMAGIMDSGLPGATFRLKSAFAGLLLTIGIDGGINGALETLFDKISSLLGWLSTLNPKVFKWGAVMAGVVAIFGPLLFMFGVFLTMLPGMISGYTLLTLATGKFKIAIFKNMIPAIGASIKSLFAMGAALWTAMAPLLVIALKVAAVAAALYALYKVLNTIVEFAMDAWFDGFGKAWDNLLNKLKSGYNEIKSFFGFGDSKSDSNINVTGKPLGAKEVKASADKRDFVTRTNHANVTIQDKTGDNFVLRSSSEGEGDFLNVLNGPIGAL